MRKALFSIVAGSLLMAGAGLASAQSETPTQPSWNANQGTMLREYSVTRHYKSYDNSSMRPTIGMTLPSDVNVYPLPDDMKVPSSQRYEYGMINDRPVVVERTTRKVVHTWD